MELEMGPAEILSTKGCPHRVEKDYLKMRDEKKVFFIKEGRNSL